MSTFSKSQREKLNIPPYQYYHWGDFPTSLLICPSSSGTLFLLKLNCFFQTHLWSLWFFLQSPFKGFNRFLSKILAKIPNATVCLFVFTQDGNYFLSHTENLNPKSRNESVPWGTDKSIYFNFREVRLEEYKLIFVSHKTKKPISVSHRISY